MKHEEDKKEEKAKKGKKKAEMKMEGDKKKMRHDRPKRASGGRMSDGSPYSAAAKTSAPKGQKESASTDMSDD